MFLFFIKQLLCCNIYIDNGCTLFFKCFNVLTCNISYADFGIVLGSRIFIKEGAKSGGSGDSSLQEGDVLLKINNHSVSDGMTLKEARRLIESAKDKLSLTVRRESSGNGLLQYSGSSEPTSLQAKGNVVQSTVGCMAWQSGLFGSG